MDFDFTTETITPDSTNLLTIGGTGGLEVPVGTTIQRPVTGLVNGTLRYNTDLNVLEGYINNSWSSQSGSVTSVAITGSTGLSVSGSPITSSGTITLTNTGVTSAVGTSGNITVSGATGAVTFNLATAGTPVSNQFVKITTDTFGRVTSTSSVSSSDITTSLGYTPVNRAGDTMSGVLNMGSNIISNVATPVAGTDAANKNYVDASVTGLSWKQAVRAATTVNGTLSTAYANGSVIDGVTLATNDRILIKNQTTQTENGIYVVAASGAPARATDSDSGVELVCESVFVDQGTLADTGWTQVTNAPITIGSSNIVYAQFTGSGTYTAGTGLTLTGNTFSLTSAVSPTLGGTGTTTAPTSGQVLVGTSGNVYAPATIGTSTGISITSGSGSLTINNTGVTSAIGTSGNITVSGATGAVTFNLATAGTAGTYGSVTTDTFGRVTSGSATTPIANGGTALSTTPTNGQLLIGNGTNYTLSTLTAGTGISVTNGSGSINIANTGVTSVALSLPSIFTVSGSPVTTTGTLTGTLASQTANTVFSAPNGSSGTPTFRTLVLADLTSAIQLYRENPSSPTTPLVAGTNAVAIGTGSSASAIQGFAVGNGSNANIFGIRAYANGSTATAGDAQAIDALLRNTTTNNTTTELFLDGTAGAQRLVLSNNSAWTFSIKIVARRTDATGSLGSWIFTGLIYRDASAGTTTLSGISKTTVARIGSIVSANDPVVTADTTNGSLKISVTGVTSQTYRWVADVELVQVTN